MKGGNSGNNGSEFDMADRKAFEAYCTNFEELFLSHCEVMRQGTVLQDSTPIIFNKLETTPEVRPEPSRSRNDVQSLINSALERQAKSTDELLRRLIVERNGKKHNDSIVNPSSTNVVGFPQINPHTSGPSAGGTLMPNPFGQPVNHFHSQTTIKSSAPNLGMPQQTTTSMFRQGCTHTTLSFTIPNPGSAPYTSGYNGRTCPNPNGNYQVPYTTVAYTDPIPLLYSSLGFLPNHAYQNMPCFNTYDQSKTGGFHFKTPP
jgi:hypothetical protein